MDSFLVELIVVFVVAVLTGIAFRFCGLPSIIGHVLAGLILGLSGFISAPSAQVLNSLGTIGVTLLLFLVGLEMDWKGVKKVGREVVLLFFGQTFLLMAAYSVLGVFALGFSWLTAVLFAVSLTFSSTIVVVKVLSEKKELTSYTGRLSLGILLLQDILAIAVLVFLPGLGSNFDISNLGILVLKLVGVFLLTNVVGQYLISLLMKTVIRTAEDLVLFSLAWFAVVTYVSVAIFGLTPEIGGLLAGLSLSSSWGHFQIVSKVKILRDVFVTMFFVFLGFEVGLGGVDWTLVAVFIPLIVVVKFLVTHMVARIVGLNGRTAILVGLNMTQVSEFSLVVMSAGLALSLWSADLVRAVTLATLFSMALSTILISKADKLSLKISKLSKLLFIFGGKNKPVKVDQKDHIVLFGGDRTGKSILSFLSKNGERTVVVDYNPQVVTELINKGESVIFADATDPDVLELTNIAEAKLVISTMKNVNDSLSLLNDLENKGIKVPVIADAESIAQAKELYAAGAAYVIFPHFVSGLHMGQVIRKMGKDKDILSKYHKRQDTVMKEAYEGEY